MNRIFYLLILLLITTFAQGQNWNNYTFLNFDYKNGGFLQWKSGTWYRSNIKVVSASDTGAVTPTQKASWDSKQNLYSNYYIVSTISALQTYVAGLGAGVDVNIWFPAGTYSVTTPITISNKGTVRIKSEGAIIANALAATGS